MAEYMTINSVIETVSRLKPGAVEDRDMARWLLDLDGRLRQRLLPVEDKPEEGQPEERPEDKPEEGPEAPVEAEAPVEPEGEDAGDGEQSGPPMSWPEDGDKPLFVPVEYGELYVFYVIAMVEFYTREYGSYNNTIILFNDRLSDFLRAWRRAHRPAPRGAVRVMD